MANIDEFNEEMLRKVKSMNKEEREKYLLSLPREKAASYKEIFMRVEELEDFFYILSNLPKESFKNIFNLLVKEVGENPANILKDYIVLEIRKFYELVYKEKRVKLPPVPEYWIKLKELRDVRIAHPDIKNDSNEEVEKFYRAIDEIGLDKIVDEFKVYARKCIDIMNKSEDKGNNSS